MDSLTISECNVSAATTFTRMKLAEKFCYRIGKKLSDKILGQYSEVDEEKKFLKEKILKKIYGQDDVGGAIVQFDRRDRLEKTILRNLRKFPYSYYNVFNTWLATPDSFICMPIRVMFGTKL